MTKFVKRPMLKTWALSLILGWCVTILAMVAFWWWEAGRLGPGEPLRYSASELLVEGAQMRREDGRIVVEQLDRDELVPDYLSAEHAAVVWTGPDFQEVHPYRYAVCRCSRSGSDASLSFMWQSGRFSETRSVDYATGPGGVLAVPGDSSDWVGTVFALGILLRGGEATHFSIEALELYPDSAWMRIQSAWVHWFAFHPWDMKSINTIGKDSGNEPSLLVISLVAGLISIAFFLAMSVSSGSSGRLTGIVLLAAVSWLLLDVRWFVHLSQQVTLTSEEYAGRSLEERVAQEQYGPITELAKRVRESLPSDRSTLFIVTENPEARFFQERLAFHLYPLNVFNFKQRFWLFKEDVRPGEFLLVLESSEDVPYDAMNSELRWLGKGRICAERMFTQSVASLYRICNPEA